MLTIKPGQVIKQYILLGFYPILSVIQSVYSHLTCTAYMKTKAVIYFFISFQHGSTYGGNPLGCRVGITALKVRHKN